MPADRADFQPARRLFLCAAGAAVATPTCPDSLSRLSRFRSEQRSAACWYRIALSFSSDRAMIVSSEAGRAWFTRLGPGGLAFKIAFINSTRFLPAKGRLP